MDLLDFVHRRHPKALVARVVRDGQDVVVSAARVASLVGRDGAAAASLEGALSEALGAPITLHIEEIRSPEREPVLLARHIWRTTQPVLVVDDDGNESEDAAVDIGRVRQVAERSAEQAKRLGASSCGIAVRGAFGDVIAGDDAPRTDGDRATIDENGVIVEVAVGR